MAAGALAKRVRVLVQITRIDNSFFAGAYTLVGAYLAGGLAAVGSAHALTAALIVGLIVACGFVVNDCYDLPVDALSKPDRPIPSGAISHMGAWWLACALAGAALALAWAGSVYLGLFALGTLALTIAYSHTLKHTLLLGNMTTAVLNSSIVLFGSLATGTLVYGAIFTALMMFFFCLGQEVLYAVEDIDGDAQGGARTTAVRLGRERALSFYYVFGCAFVVAALLPWALGLAGSAYLLAVLGCSIIPVLLIMVFVRRRPTTHMVFIAGRLLKTCWLLGLVPVLLLR
jgi:geranylgeranylglycerol-phosphate geranylgeranyltransferase